MLPLYTAICKSDELPKQVADPNTTPANALPVPWYLNYSVSQPGSPLLFLLRFPFFLELLQFCFR